MDLNGAIQGQKQIHQQAERQLPEVQRLLDEAGLPYQVLDNSPVKGLLGLGIGSKEALDNASAAQNNREIAMRLLTQVNPESENYRFFTPQEVVAKFQEQYVPETTSEKQE